MNTLFNADLVMSILKSNDNGQGKTSDIHLDLQWLDATTFIYKSNKVSLNSPEHLAAMFAMMFHNVNKSKDSQSLQKFIEHISSGAYLTMTHSSVSTKVTPDVLGNYRESISLLGLTSVEKVSKQSKLLACYFASADKTVKQSLSFRGYSS